MTAVAALCAPGSALAGPKANAPEVVPQVAPAAEVAERAAEKAPVFAWFANWTW